MSESATPGRATVQGKRVNSRDSSASTSRHTVVQPNSRMASAIKSLPIVAFEARVDRLHLFGEQFAVAFRNVIDLDFRAKEIERRVDLDELRRPAETSSRCRSTLQ